MQGERCRVSAMVIVSMKNIVITSLLIFILLMIGTLMKETHVVELTQKLFKENSKIEKEKLPQVYGDRRDHIAEMCRKHKADISRRYKKFWPRENYNSVMGKADVFYNRKIKFLWCRVPKAASESWSGVFINKWYAAFSKNII